MTGVLIAPQQAGAVRQEWAAWTQGEQLDTAVATWSSGDDTEAATLRVDSGGRLIEVTVNRWGNPGGAPFGRYPFGVRVDADGTSAGSPSRRCSRRLVGHQPGGRRRVLPGAGHQGDLQVGRVHHR